MNILLIPSAKLIDSKIQKTVGEIPPVLFPLNSKTVLERLCEKYSNQVDKIYVSTFEKFELVEDYIHWKKLPVEIIKLNSLGFLGDSILKCLEVINEENPIVDNLIINFGDTIIDEDVNFENNIGYKESMLCEEWTYFDNNNNELELLFDKEEVDSSDKNKYKLFVGLFCINDINDFLFYLRKYKKLKFNSDFFYEAIVDYSKQHVFSYQLIDKWFDVGHIENIKTAKTGVAARAFNSIDIDENRGLLTKRSENVDKFISEILWYLRIPKKLQYLIPRIYDYSIDIENTYIQMEYYGYNTLHELLIFGELPLLKWQQIFERLKFMIKEMAGYTFCGNRLDIKQSLEDIYINKTIQRLNKLKSDSNFQIFFENEIHINGIKYPSLSRYIEIMPQILGSRLINNFTGNFSIIHGDLCFSNILIEEGHNFLRIIDPRGQFGSFDLYGDPRYELAKLFHTLEGNYDLIIEDMFELNIKNTNIEFLLPAKTKKVFNIFKDVFNDNIENINDIRLIESLLFFSMIPLHSDNLKRQYAMLATALSLWEEAL